MKKETFPLFILVLLASSLLCLSGCVSTSGLVQAEPALQVEANTNQAAAVLPTATLPSVSVQTLIETDGYPEPGLVILEESDLPAPVIASSEAGEPLKPTPVPTEALPEATPTPLPTAEIVPPTLTPAPTFTLPPQLEGTVKSHFWMKRPIPDGGVVWTDKAYPYGGTKGNTLRTHHGVEFFVSEGTPVLAVAEGEVIVAGDDLQTPYGPHTNFYGNLVIIRHDISYQGQAVYTLYGHLSGVTVAVGDRVTTDDLIGYSGATGIAFGPHLHFEVRVGSNLYNTTRNPLVWLWPFPEHGVIAGRVTFPSGADALEAPVKYRRLDVSGDPVKTVYTYAGNTVNGDEVWGENFAADDVFAGYYEVFIDLGGTRVSREVWVYPWETTFVEFVIGEE